MTGEPLYRVVRDCLPGQVTVKQTEDVKMWGGHSGQRNGQGEALRWEHEEQRRLGSSVRTGGREGKGPPRPRGGLNCAQTKSAAIRALRVEEGCGWIWF